MRLFLLILHIPNNRIYYKTMKQEEGHFKKRMVAVFQLKACVEYIKPNTGKTFIRLYMHSSEFHVVQQYCNLRYLK